jgi:hypothetical protein
LLSTGGRAQREGAEPPLTLPAEALLLRSPVKGALPASLEKENGISHRTSGSEVLFISHHPLRPGKVSRLWPKVATSFMIPCSCWASGP